MRVISNKRIIEFSASYPNAILISETANRQFLGGDINYLDWVMLVNQALTIHNSYIDTINLYNESVIEWNYLTSKN